MYVCHIIMFSMSSHVISPIVGQITMINIIGLTTLLNSISQYQIPLWSKQKSHQWGISLNSTNIGKELYLFYHVIYIMFSWRNLLNYIIWAYHSIVLIIEFIKLYLSNFIKLQFLLLLTNLEIYWISQIKSWLYIYIYNFSNFNKLLNQKNIIEATTITKFTKSTLSIF